MPATYLEAESEGYVPLYTTVASTEMMTLLGYEPQVFFADVESGDFPLERIYLRASFNEIDAGQTALMNCVTELGKRKHKREGSIVVEIFGPRSVGNGTVLMKQIGQMLREAYTTSKNNIGLWYTAPRIMRAYQEDSRWRINFIVEYHYTEVI